MLTMRIFLSTLSSCRQDWKTIRKGNNNCFPDRLVIEKRPHPFGEVAFSMLLFYLEEGFQPILAICANHYFELTRFHYFPHVDIPKG